MKRTIAILGIALGISAAAWAQTAEKRLDASPGQALEIRLETGGAIHIRGGAASGVVVKSTLRGRDSEQIDVVVEKSANGVRIGSKYRREGRRHSGGVDFDITVPARFDVEFTTMGGDVRINGVEGTMKGKTMGGELDLSNLKGTVNMSTMGGDVSLVSSTVDGEVSTMGGEVKLKDVSGDVKGKSMGGDVIYDNVQRPGMTSGNKAVEISTMGGDVNVASAPAGAKVSTMGGDINIGSAKDFVKATTMGGDIEIKELDGGVTASTMGGDITVTMVGDPATGKRDVELESKGGEIRLTVPAALSMSLDIEIDYTRNSSRDFKIVSDFSLATNDVSDWSYSHGDARKTIRGTASIAGGKNKIVIRTINGNVFLKKR